MVLNIALLGAGIFATEAHLPAIQAQGAAVHLSAIYSRSAKSSTALATTASELLGYEVLAYSDENSAADLTALLRREDVQAVIVALPINTQPGVILLALNAGKHVLSEKPVHNSVKLGRGLLDKYDEAYKKTGPHWRVAENFEVEPSFLQARDVIRAGTIGDVAFFKHSSVLYIDEETSKYYKTPWRTKPEYQGGFLLDGGVHYAALLRTILPADQKMTSLVGYTSLNRPNLAPTDTINAVIQLEAPADKEKLTAHGIFELSFGLPGPSTAAKETNGTIITGTKGWLSLSNFAKEGGPYWRLKVSTYVKNATTGALEEQVEVTETRGQGVEREVEYFVKLIEGGEGADLGFGSLEGALADVAVIEAALISQGKEVKLL